MFSPDVIRNAGEPLRVYNDLRRVLRDLGIQAHEAGNQELVTDYTPSAAYEPIRVKFLFPERFGVLAVEGLLLPLADEPNQDVRLALNYLNTEISVYGFYISPTGEGPEIVVRQCLYPNLQQAPSLHPREVQQALTGLCAQKAIFAGPLGRVVEGHSWRFVKEALKAVR